MKLSYYNSNYNFGDLLNITLLEDLFGVNNIIHDNSAIDADMIAIGSLFERLVIPKVKRPTLKSKFKHKKKLYSIPKIEVFGTGFIQSHTNSLEFIRRLNLIAVRGKLTKQKVDSITNKNNKVVLGDPGLLCKELIDTTKIKKRYKLGIIPHYVDKTNNYISEIHKNTKSSIVIDIQQEPYKFLKEISQCEAILSSAMHGLIAADSLNIPNLRLTVSDKLTGGDYKFHDYYSVFDINNHENINFFNGSYTIGDIQRLEDVIHEKFISKDSKIDTINTSLLKAFKSKSKYA